MVAVNEKHPAHEKLRAILRRESLMLSVESARSPISEALLKPTVFMPVRRGETLIHGNVAVYKV